MSIFARIWSGYIHLVVVVVVVVVVVAVAVAVAVAVVVVMTSPSFTSALVRVATHPENLELSGNLTLVSQKSGKLGKVKEIVVCLCCAITVAVTTK